MSQHERLDHIPDALYNLVMSSKYGLELANSYSHDGKFKTEKLLDDYLQKWSKQLTDLAWEVKLRRRWGHIYKMHIYDVVLDAHKLVTDKFTVGDFAIAQQYWRYKNRTQLVLIHQTIIDMIKALESKYNDINITTAFWFCPEFCYNEVVNKHNKGMAIDFTIPSVGGEEVESTLRDSGFDKFFLEIYPTYFHLHLNRSRIFVRDTEAACLTYYESCLDRRLPQQERLKRHPDKSL